MAHWPLVTSPPQTLLVQAQAQAQVQVPMLLAMVGAQKRCLAPPLLHQHAPLGSPCLLPVLMQVRAQGLRTQVMEVAADDPAAQGCLACDALCLALLGPVPAPGPGAAMTAGLHGWSQQQQQQQGAQKKWIQEPLMLLVQGRHALTGGARWHEASRQQPYGQQRLDAQEGKARQAQSLQQVLQRPQGLAHRDTGEAGVGQAVSNSLAPPSSAAQLEPGAA